ncbi:MAG: CZB domain-containing protein [Rhodospirillaceae bacterium]
MSYEQHDLFRDRLAALPLDAGRRGIAAMVLVEIVRWMPKEDSHLTTTVEKLGGLLRLKPSEVASALDTLKMLGVVETVPMGPALQINLQLLSGEKSIELLHSEITAAIHSHGDWKRQLRHAIEAGRTDLNIAEVARDDCCEFGRWLYGSSFTDAERDGTYKHIRLLHAHFHRIAAITLQLVLKGKNEAAEHSMSANGIYARTSLRLLTALNKWRGTTTS